MAGILKKMTGGTDSELMNGRCQFISVVVIIHSGN